MQKIILYISIALLTLVNSVVAQEKTLEKKLLAIAVNIKVATDEEKKILKKEVESIDAQVKNGEITNEEGKRLKTKFSEERAKNIETKIAEQEKALLDLVNENVTLEESNDSLKKNSFGFKSKNFDLWLCNRLKGIAPVQLHHYRGVIQGSRSHHRPTRRAPRLGHHDDGRQVPYRRVA